MKKNIIFIIGLIALFSILLFINISPFDLTTLSENNLAICEYQASLIFNMPCDGIKYVVDSFNIIHAIPVIALFVTIFVRPVWKSLFLVFLTEIMWILISQFITSLFNIPAIYFYESDLRLVKLALFDSPIIIILTIFMTAIGLVVPTLIILIRKDFIKV